MSVAAAYTSGTTAALASIQASITTSEAIYQKLHDFAYGLDAAPDWPTYLSRWRAALDQQQQALAELSMLNGGV